MRMLSLALCLSACFVSSAFGGIITTTADVIATDPNGGVPGGLVGPPLTGIDVFNFTGKTFTNTYNIPPGPSSPPDGRRVRSIVGHQLNSLVNHATYTPVRTVGGDEIFAVTVVDGVLLAPGVASFTSGRIGFVAGSGFDPNDPTTWGLTLAGGSVAGSFFAEYSLGDPDFVTFNNGDPVFFASSSVNLSSLDSVAFNEQTQGRFNFVEDSPAGATPGNDFVTTTPSVVVPGVPGPVNIEPGPRKEGLFATTSDVIEQNSRAQILGQFSGGIGAGQDILNGIGIWGIGAGVDGGASAGFATWGSGDSFDFIPGFVAGINSTGDFRANNTTIHRPSVQAIPEPVSATVWAGLMLVVAGRRRKRA